MAKRNLKPLVDMLFHSDHGVQHVADEFLKDLRKEKVIQSMTRKGNCWDNAFTENFFKIIKSMRKNLFYLRQRVYSNHLE